MISVVVPALDEASGIAVCLASARDPHVADIIVVDGGSRDATSALAGRLADRVRRAAPGRALQMNAGAAIARGDVLLFLHADSRLPAGFGASVTRAIEGGAVGGRFDVRLRGRHPGFPLLGAAINARSRWSGIATGDQAIFVRRTTFDAIGGFEPIPLMEDVRLSRTLGRCGSFVALRDRVETSGRRWEEYGFVRTVLLMWRLRFLHACGVPPEDLVGRYPPHRARE